MKSAGSFTIPSDHPALPGHFPGRPVVPGVVLLDEALALLQASCGSSSPRNFRRAKFFRPVSAGERIEVQYTEGDTGFELVCRCGETIVLGARIARA